MLLKNLALILLSGIISSTTYAVEFGGGENPWDFEYMLETCGSLEKYKSEYMRCNQSGFTYETIDARFYNNNGEMVIMEIDQAKLGRDLYDSHIVKVVSEKYDTTLTTEASINDTLIALTENINANSIMVRDHTSASSSRDFSVMASSNWKWGIVQDFLTGVGSSMTVEGAKKLLEDRADDSNSGAAVIMLIDGDGKPVGSGYIKNGDIVSEVLLVENHEGERVWSGPISFDRSVKLNKSWNGFSSGGSTCKYVYTGSGNGLYAQVVCW